MERDEVQMRNHDASDIGAQSRRSSTRAFAGFQQILKRRGAI
jgi:hypothetical protein